jgi:tetratricopeptide (TPR) repeat protein
VFNLAQLKSFRAYAVAQTAEDARQAATDAVAEARRFLELGDRPVSARLSLADALGTEADVRWLEGEATDALFEEAAVAVREAAALAPKNWNVFTTGLPLVLTWANEALAEGRRPETALRDGAAWASALSPLVAENAVFAGHVGAFHLVEARAELLAGRDPTAALERAEPLLARLAESQSVNRDALAEAALTRAAWARAHAKDPAPALKVALTQARAAKSLDETDAEAWLLEGRVLLAQGADRQLASKSILQSLKLSPRQGVAWLAHARALEALGDVEGAREAREKALKLQPRLAH